MLDRAVSADASNGLGDHARIVERPVVRKSRGWRSPGGAEIARHPCAVVDQAADALAGREAPVYLILGPRPLPPHHNARPKIAGDRAGIADDVLVEEPAVIEGG